MKKPDDPATDDLRPEYDFRSMKGSVRGKYAKRFRDGTNIVLTDPEMVEAFRLRPQSTKRYAVC